MERRYLTAVAPLPDHILQVDFVSGARLLLDMNPYLDKIRFLPLADPKVWNSAVTNGMTETTFAPNAACTRAQIVTFLYRCLG